MMTSNVFRMVVVLGVAFSSVALAQGKSHSTPPIEAADIIFMPPQTDRPEHWVGRLVFNRQVRGYCLELDGKGNVLRLLCRKTRQDFACLEALHKMMGDKAASVWMTYQQVVDVSAATGQLVNKYLFKVQGSDEVHCTL